MTKFFCHVGVTSDKIHKSFHHPWCRSFAWMNTTCYNNGFFLLKGEKVKMIIRTMMMMWELCVSPFASPLLVLSVQSQWDNRHYFLLTIYTRDAICRISILLDVSVCSLDSPANQSTCMDSCAQNRRYHSHIEIRRWMLMCTSKYCHCHRHRNHQ